MSKFKAILWDVYGTLVSAKRGDLDSLVKRHDELRAAFQQTVSAFGISATAEELHEAFLSGIAAERESKISKGVVYPEVRIDELWYKLLVKFSPRQQPTMALARETALLFEHHANPKTLQPNAYKTLVELHERKMRQGIISNAQFYTPVELGEMLSAVSGDNLGVFTSIFDPKLVLLSCDLGVSKPDVLGFRRATEVLVHYGIMPSETAYVGNSTVNDIDPAIETGFFAVLYAQPDAPAPETKANLVITDLLQLLEYV